MQKSHLGASYFTESSLKTHDWFNATFVRNIESSNIILIPFDFTSALTGRCGNALTRRYSNRKIVEELNEYMKNILIQLKKMKRNLYRKAILFVMQDPR